MPLIQNTGATAVVNQQLYVAAAATPSRTDLEVYDPVTAVWTLKAPSPIGRAYTTGAGISGKFYLAGGCGLSWDCRIGTTNLLEVYDPLTNAWTTKAPMPTARSLAAGAVIGGKLYVVGGRGPCAPCGYGQSLIAALEVYDPATDSWTSKAPMPSARTTVAAVAVNGKLYVVGVDSTLSGFVGRLDVYDPVTNSWSAKTPMSTPRWAAGAAEIDGIIYSVSGLAVVNGSTASAAVEAYDPVTDQWTTVAPIPTALVYTRPQSIGGALYVVGTSAALSTQLQVFTPASLPPLDIPSNTPQVSAGNLHTCAVTTSGTVVCWGDNTDGKATPPLGLASVAQVSAGRSSTCALKTDGTVVCWGGNVLGEGNVPAGLSGVVQISDNDAYVCAVKADRTVVCWGANGDGQANVPPGLTSVTQVSAGINHTCAVKTDRSVVCWGGGTAAGNPDYGQAIVPAGLSAVVQVSASAFHTCALRAFGTVVCWGRNDRGQTAVPDGLASVSQLSAGQEHYCALKTDATVVCWGDNLFGQTSVPSGLDSVAQLSNPNGPNYHTCAVRTNGAVVCWGANNRGQATVPTGLNPYGAAPQSITFTSTAPSPAHVGDTYAIAATATSGLPVTFSTFTPAICSVSGSAVSFTTVGICTVTANQAGDAAFLAAPEQTQSITIVQRPQTITFTSTAPTLPLVGETYGVTAVASSGLTVSLTSLTPAICTVAGNTANFAAAGSCTIAANQAGNAAYLAAPEQTQSITVITPAQATQNLIGAIAGMGLPAGVANSLSAPLNNINTSNVSAACGKLNAFSNQVKSKVQGGQLTAPAGTQLLDAAQAIAASLGCA